MNQTSLTRSTQNTPIAYLFNGVRLPPLPDWDKELYPYAVIRKTVTNKQFWLTLAKTRPYADADSEPNRNTPVRFALPYALYLWRDGETAWTFYKEYGTDYPNGGFFEVLGNILWTNVDIKAGSNVVFAASDPIPVNPAPTLDPTALLMCWQVGNRIASMRK